MRKKAFRRFLVVVLLIAVGFYTVKSCAPGVKQRLTADRPTQPVYTYQKAVEKRTEGKIGDVLRQVYGKDAYFVSVAATLHLKEETFEAKRMVPRTISTNITEKTTYEMMSSKNLALAAKPVTEPKRLSGYSQNNDKIRKKMPGLISRLSFMPGYGKALPGFPAIATPSVVKQVKKKDKKNYTDPNRSAADEKNVLTKEKMHDHLYYDEIFETTSTPDTKIDRLYVSVGVDKKRFEERAVPEEELKRLIQNMAGIYPERGDQVVISILPMKHPWINMEAIAKKYGPYVTAVKQFVIKYKEVFIGLLGLLLLYLVFKGFKKLWTIRKAKKEKLRQEALKKKAAEVAEEKKVQESIEQEKQNAVTELAKEKPSEFASLLINWAEKD